ncbi:hypothetical protein GOP47_0019109 [Adiantum capillus-veneris]|uniref:Uncharacterized protein n=1 Tax=Adiantum capillus-veneris TaxID=13818 RepID=A0A9D4UEM7_ADICA|nr:hypothetical protein GOP47_0019109 [Adiantum capillus-veneris]
MLVYASHYAALQPACSTLERVYAVRYGRLAARLSCLLAGCWHWPPENHYAGYPHLAARTPICSTYGLPVGHRLGLSTLSSCPEDEGTVP